MKLVVALLALLQFGPRPPLTPAETLLEPSVLRAIQEQEPTAQAGTTVTGTDPVDVLVTCAETSCGTAERAVRKLSALIEAKRIPQPTRTIRVSSTPGADNARRAIAVIHVAEVVDRGPLVLRGLWSTAGIGDEAAEVFARQLLPNVEVRAYESVGQPGFDGYGVPTTTIVANRPCRTTRRQPSLQ